MMEWDTIGMIGIIVFLILILVLFGVLISIAIQSDKIVSQKVDFCENIFGNPVRGGRGIVYCDFQEGEGDRVYQRYTVEGEKEEMYLIKLK